jgi:hypothetical protein
VGPVSRHEHEGRTELRYAVPWSDEGTAEIVEELAW